MTLANFIQTQMEWDAMPVWVNVVIWVMGTLLATILATSFVWSLQYKEYKYPVVSAILLSVLTGIVLVR